MSDRTPTTAAGRALEQRLAYDCDPAHYEPGDFFIDDRRDILTIEAEARAEPRAERLDVNALRDAARRSGMPINVTVADIENLVIEYNSGVQYWDGKDAALAIEDEAHAPLTVKPSLGHYSKCSKVAGRLNG